MTRKKKGKDDLPDTFSNILGKKNKHTKEEEHLVKIIPGIGVGNIRLGMSFKDITRQFGEPEKISKFEEGRQIYYIYYSKGIQIFFENKKIKTIILLSGLKGDMEVSSYKSFPGITDRGITMRSTYKDIINAYGKPNKVTDFNNLKIPSQRITYDGITFNFVMKTKQLLNINIITAEKLTTEEDIISKEPVKVPSKKLGIECAGCHGNFEWNDAYAISNTPGSLNHNPPGSGNWRPRVFCPYCGALIAEWHITREKDFDEWIWFGSNASLNTGRSLPPNPLTLWGKVVPSKYMPYFDEHQLNIEKVKQSATKKQPQAEIQPEREQNWKQLANEGFKYFKEGNIKKAVELVQKAVAAGLPKHEHALTLGAIGEHYLLNEKDVDSALKYFLSSIEKDFSAFWKAHAYLALIYEAMGNYQKRDQERRDAQRAEPHKFLIHVYEQNVRQITQKWIREKKSSVEEEKFDITKPALDKEEVYARFIQKAAKEAKVHYDHGIEFCQKYLWVDGIGDGAYAAIHRAMQEFKAALKIDPNFQLARLALADCYFKVMDPLNFFDASMLYQKAIRDSPDLVVDVEQASLGDRYMKQGSDKAHQAAIAYRKAIKIKPVIW